MDWKVEKIEEFIYRIPKEGKMRVEGRLYISEKMISHLKKDNTPLQVVNVAHLPGIVKYSLAMPDMHWGYGFCIGGVAAMDINKNGVISPGGIGYDINCGVRLIRTNLTFDEIKERIEDIMSALFVNIPSGVG